MTWYYASVTEVVATDGDKATLRVLYDDYAPDDPAGQDLINVPDDDTVTCDPAQPRVKASADDRLRIGKTFVWSRNSPREKREPGRWRITDIFDSLEEGADGVVATYARVERRGDAAADSSDDDARAAPTRAEELHLLVKHARWDDAAPPPPPKPLKRRKEGAEKAARRRRRRRSPTTARRRRATRPARRRRRRPRRRRPRRRRRRRRRRRCRPSPRRSGTRRRARGDGHRGLTKGAWAHDHHVPRSAPQARRRLRMRTRRRQTRRYAPVITNFVRLSLV